ncbi:MAG TPA: GNAT family N-acetyltransferase [Clostridia bacterium]|nr:GNAT family N-acetyltransferase [Clostridia bacterium]
MEIDIRPLTPALLDDYLCFFNNVAFTDHPEWSQCYCVHFHWNDQCEAESMSGGKSSLDLAVHMIRNGVIRGYLAYWEGKVVGWCNVNDKRGYDALRKRPELWDDADPSSKTKAIVCFLVAPEMRGKGIASQLLRRACADAAGEGYDFFEGYPPAGACDMYAAHHGTIPLFERHGFSLCKTLGRDAVMRKRLR